MRMPTLRLPRPRAALALPLLALGACYVENELGDGGRPDAASPDAAPATDVVQLSCGSAPLVALGRACSVHGDCAIADHQIDCCGTHVVTGIRADALAQFEPAEASCRSSYGACRCATRPTVADDGSSELGGGSASVSCQAGRCLTRYLPSACSAQADCGPGYACCYPCGVEGCALRCEPACADGAPGCLDGCLLRP